MDNASLLPFVVSGAGMAADLPDMPLQPYNGEPIGDWVIRTLVLCAVMLAVKEYDRWRDKDKKSE